jgi:hypothetical protein
MAKNFLEPPKGTPYSQQSRSKTDKLADRQQQIRPLGSTGIERSEAPRITTEALCLKLKIATAALKQMALARTSLISLTLNLLTGLTRLKMEKRRLVNGANPTHRVLKRRLAENTPPLSKRKSRNRAMAMAASHRSALAFF